MDMDLTEDSASKHRVPIIDKMMDILSIIEKHSEGVTISTLVAKLDMPRTTIYRVLNSLQAHDMVRRDGEGAYLLGRRLLALAAHVVPTIGDIDLIAFSQPHLERLAEELGEGVKLSVIDDVGILVAAAAQGRGPFALSVAPGQRMPIHAGAASKMLLCYASKDRLLDLLSKPLPVFSPKTITDPAKLRSELTRIKKQGWAHDRGENGPSILAYAAPVFKPEGEIVASISVPFLLGTAPSRMEEIKLAVIRAAQAMTDSLAE
jgi:DNA-binding IclR family transcriptional regulator